MAASNAAPSPTARTTTIVWFRRDLRLDDNHALIAASLCGAVVPVFVWSPEEEGQFYPGRVARWWLKQSLAHLRAAMQDLGATLVIRRSRSTLAVLLEIISATGASQLFYNHLYDPVSLVRDHRVKEALSKRGIAVRSFNADLLFEPWEIRCGDRVGIISPSVPGGGGGGGGGAGGPANSTATGPAVSCVGESGVQKMKSGGGKGRSSSAAAAAAVDADSYASTVTFEKFLAQCLKRVPEAPLSAPKSLVMPSVRRGSTALQSCHISDLQLESPDEMSSNSLLSRAWLPGCTNADRALLAFLHGALLDYAANRGKADSATTSLLSPHLHFGEISVRRILHSVRTLEQAWVSEGLPNASASAAEFFRSLCFREYSRFLTFNFPFTHERSLLCHLKFFPWNVDEGLFKAWRQGRTGYPLVDAAMRELWATGWMHNRLRVVTASFCVKYLQLPWRWGMKYFWDALLDADLECDVLGWQYVSGSLPDGHELDRMDDPEEWGWRIDPEGEYIRRWLPELSRLPTEWLHRPWEAPPQLLRAAGVELGYTYPRPVVDVCTARKQLEHALDTMWQREASRRAALANGVEEGGGEHAPPVQEATSRLSKHSAAAAMEARDSSAARGGPLPSGAAAAPMAVAGAAAGGIAAGGAGMPIVPCGLDQMVPSLEAVEAADAILNPAQRISKLAAAGAGADDLEAIQPRLPQEISLVNHVGQGRSDGGAAEQVVDGASGVEMATGPVELQLFPCLASGKATEEAGSAVQQQPGEAAASMHRQVPVAGLLKQSLTSSVKGGDGQSNAMKLPRETGWRVSGGTGGMGRRVDASITQSLDLAASAAQARTPSPADNLRDGRVTPTTATYRQHVAVPTLPSLGASTPAASSTPNAAGLGSAGGAATFSAVMGGLWRVPGGGQAGMISAAQPAPMASPLQPLETAPSSATPSALAKKSEEKALLMMAKNPKRGRANLDLLEPAVVPAPRRRSVNPK